MAYIMDYEGLCKVLFVLFVLIQDKGQAQQGCEEWKLSSKEEVG